MHERIRRVIIAFNVSALVLVLPWLASAPPASAHVTARLDEGAPGEYGLITLRVPTESDTASTTKVEVRIPDDVHLASVLVEPQPGWRVDVAKQHIPPMSHHGAEITEAVTSIVWTAAGGGIAPGQFGRFVLLAGPLPETAALSLPTVQTYSDGSAVAWNQQAVGDAQPDRPAPTVALIAAGAPAAPPDSSIDIAWIALALAAIALVFAGLSAVRVMRSTGRPHSR